MTPTARGSGLRVDWWVDERRDPVRSTDAAMKFINHLKDQFGSLYIAAAAYNGGPGRMARGLKKYEDELEGMSGDDAFFALAEKKFLPAETKDYVPQLIAAALVGKNPEKYGMKVDRLPPFAYDSVMVPPATPLAAIAKAVGVPVRQIQELNTHILRGVSPPTGPLQVRVPVGSAAVFDSALAALDSADRVAFRKATVGKKQTMASVASKYALTEKQLSWYNPKLIKSKTGRLQAGQPLRIPTPAVVAAALDVPDPEIAIWSSSSRTHIVKRGENLSTIAKKYKTTVKDIMRRNGLKKALIMPGQSLVVSGKAKAAPRRSARKTTTTKAATKKSTSSRPASKQPR
jgi:membrane-bound lytic murein transglycosylase D